MSERFEGLDPRLPRGALAIDCREAVAIMLRRWWREDPARIFPDGADGTAVPVVNGSNVYLKAIP